MAEKEVGPSRRLGSLGRYSCSCDSRANELNPQPSPAPKGPGPQQRIAWRTNRSSRGSPRADPIADNHPKRPACRAPPSPWRTSSPDTFCPHPALPGLGRLRTLCPRPFPPSRPGPLSLHFRSHAVHYPVRPAGHNQEDRATELKKKLIPLRNKLRYIPLIPFWSVSGRWTLATTVARAGCLSEKTSDPLVPVFFLRHRNRESPRPAAAKLNANSLSHVGQKFRAALTARSRLNLSRAQLSRLFLCSKFVEKAPFSVPKGSSLGTASGGSENLRGRGDGSAGFRGDGRGRPAADRPGSIAPAAVGGGAWFGSPPQGGGRERPSAQQTA